MLTAIRKAVAAIGGALVGYLCLTVMANLERWQFHSIRSWVTGKSAMSDIVAHPADQWVIPVLLVAFVCGGAACGVWIASQLKSRSASRT